MDVDEKLEQLRSMGIQGSTLELRSMLKLYGSVDSTLAAWFQSHVSAPVSTAGTTGTPSPVVAPQAPSGKKTLAQKRALAAAAEQEIIDRHAPITSRSSNNNNNNNKNNNNSGRISNSKTTANSSGGSGGGSGIRSAGPACDPKEVIILDDSSCEASQSQVSDSALSAGQNAAAAAATAEVTALAPKIAAVSSSQTESKPSRPSFDHAPSQQQQQPQRQPLNQTPQLSHSSSRSQSHSQSGSEPSGIKIRQQLHSKHEHEHEHMAWFRPGELCQHNASHLFLGRRIVHGHTTSRGNAMRNFYLSFSLEQGGYQKQRKGSKAVVVKKGEATNSSAGANPSAAAATAASKRDKHAGANLLFETNDAQAGDIFAWSEGVESNMPTGGAGTFRGRLPNLICSFIVPLMQAKLLLLRGHIAWDVGAVSTMQNVPLSLQVFVVPQLLSITEPGTLENRRYAHLLEAANDLLLWLQDGEEAVNAVTKQRAADADVRARKAAATPALTGAPAGAEPAAKDETSDEVSGTEPVEVSAEFAVLVDTAGGAAGAGAGAGESAAARQKVAEIPQAQQPSLLSESLTMRAYQLQALHWMLGRESTGSDHLQQLSEKSQRDKEERAGAASVEVPHNGFVVLSDVPVTDLTKAEHAVDGADEASVWQPIAAIPFNAERAWPPLHTDALLRSGAAVTDVAIKFYWNVYSQKISLRPPPPHHQASGGILADEMGLGKTVMATSLICADYVEEPVREAPNCGEVAVPKALALARRSRAVRVAEEEEREMQRELCDTDSDTDEDGDDFAVVGKEPSLEKKKKKKPKQQESGRKRRGGQVSASSSAARKKLVVQDGDDDDDEDTKVGDVAGGRGLLSSSMPVLQTQWRPSSSPPSVAEIPDGCKATAATLIVCPMTLLSQWAEEVVNKSRPGALKVAAYYGSANTTTIAGTDGGSGYQPQQPQSASYIICRDPRKLFQSDVVITSYGVLQWEMRHWLQQQEAAKDASSSSSSAALSGKKSAAGRRTGLLAPYWKRIILDEAHVIKNPRTETAQACCALRSRHRWCLTGTPLQNTIDDAFSLVRFLEHEPWSEYRFWRKVIGDPYKAGDKKGMQRLQMLLADILLRRTKTSTDASGHRIVQLPSRTVNVVPVDFDPEEREFYQAIVDRSKNVFQGYEGQPTGAKDFQPFLLKNKYAALFTLLMRMRQACDHPLLIFNKKHGESAATAAADGPSSSPSSSGDAIVAAASQAATANEDNPADDTLFNGLFGDAFLDNIWKQLQKGKEARLHEQQKQHHQRRAGRNQITNGATTDIDNANDAGNGDDDDDDDDDDDRGEAYLLELMQKLKQAISNSRNSCGDGDGDGDGDSEQFECPICLDDTKVYESGALTRCGHMLCKVCALRIWPGAKLDSSTTAAAMTSQQQQQQNSRRRLSAHPASLAATEKGLERGAKCPLCSQMVPDSGVFSLEPLIGMRNDHQQQKQKQGYEKEEMDVEEAGGAMDVQEAAEQHSATIDSSGSSSSSSSSSSNRSQGHIKGEGVSLSSTYGSWRHWGDAAHGMGGTASDPQDNDNGSSSGRLGYVSSSKLQAVISKLLFALDSRREEETWAESHQGDSDRPEEAHGSCAACGIAHGSTRPMEPSIYEDSSARHGAGSSSSSSSCSRSSSSCSTSNSMVVASNDISSSTSQGTGLRSHKSIPSVSNSEIYTGAVTHRCTGCRSSDNINCFYCDDCFSDHKCRSADAKAEEGAEAPTIKFQPKMKPTSVKVVVFSQWTTMLDTMEPALKAHGLEFRRLDGKMSQGSRAKSVAAFNSDPRCRILLASLKAGGVGLNLVAANFVILVDPWWNPSTEDQAIDRVHRLGQVRPVHVYRFVCHESVEERLLVLQNKKREMSSQALSGSLDKRDSSKLSMEELRAFFM